MQIQNGRSLLQDQEVNEEEPAPAAPTISPTETIRAKIHDLFAGDGGLTGAIAEVARLSVCRLSGRDVEAMPEEVLGPEAGISRGGDRVLLSEQPPPALHDRCGLEHLLTQVPQAGEEMVGRLSHQLRPSWPEEVSTRWDVVRDSLAGKLMDVAKEEVPGIKRLHQGVLAPDPERQLTGAAQPGAGAQVPGGGDLRTRPR
ncbi:MAG: hypothetical protein M0Z29_11325 [Actinomycetota bacterium]|nr:hypothetical protein [Actinomycetota bacterium]